MLDRDLHRARRFRLDLHLERKKTTQHLDVGRCVQRQWNRTKSAATRERKGNEQLICEMFADGHLEALPRFVLGDRLFRDLLRRFSALTKTRENFEPMRTLDLQQHHVPRAQAMLD